MTLYKDRDIRAINNPRTQNELVKRLAPSKYNFNIAFLDNVFLTKLLVGSGYAENTPWKISNPYTRRRVNINNNLKIILSNDLIRKYAENGDIGAANKLMGYNDRGDIYDPQAHQKAVQNIGKLKDSINLIIIGSTGDPYTAWMILHQIGEALGFTDRMEIDYTELRPVLSRVMISFGIPEIINSNMPNIDDEDDVMRLARLRSEGDDNEISLAELRATPDWDRLKHWHDMGKMITKELIKSCPENFKIWQTSLQAGSHISFQTAVITCLRMMKSKGQLSDDSEWMAEFLWHTGSDGEGHIRRNNKLKSIMIKHLGEAGEQMVEACYKKIEEICDEELKKATGKIFMRGITSDQFEVI